jgi:hypothetical protein
MTAPAFAQTTLTPTTPGAPKQPGMPATPAPITTNQPPPSCLRASPFATKDMDFVIRKVVAAGYTNVRGLYKGCDALWRGHALQNGIDTAIMVTPTGQVLRNGYGSFVAPIAGPVPTQ